MTGSVIDKTVIRREAEHINRIYPETTSQKKLILLVSDNSLETIALYCYHMTKRNTVLLVGDKKVSDIGALIRQFMPDEIFMNRKKVRDAQAIIKSLEIDENDSAGVLLPVSYVYGLSVVNSHLLAGGSLLLPAGSMF